MFQMIFRRAQAAVEVTIDQAINRALMMVPFLIAAGFGTAALAYQLYIEFGPVVANLVMATIFMVIGLVAATVVALRAPVVRAAAEEPAKVGEDVQSATTPAQPSAAEFSDADRELMMAAVGTLAPLATPMLLRIVARNLPLLAVLTAGIFVVTRDTGDHSAATHEAATG